MHERLIEIWLDSAGERAYQPAFVQMLVGQGYRILHSTRHGPLEFGKDVIAVAADGIPCAFQLKGNPGGRLNRTQFREIQAQLQEMVATAITYPGAPDVQHRSYLVTNGFVEEDVVLLINQMNETWARQGYGRQALRMMARGDLLSMAQETGTDLWPFSLAGIEGVIAMLGHRGDACLPLPRMHAILADIYALDEQQGQLARPELARRLPVAALLVSISLRNFAETSNHFAVLSAWVVYYAYTVAAVERHGADGLGEETLGAAREAAYAALCALTAEAVSRDSLVEGQSWTDTEFVPPRTVLVNALLAVHWMWSRASRGEPAQGGDPATRLDGGFAPRELWGEGAIPQFLAHHWYLTAKLEKEPPGPRIAALLEAVVTAQSGMNGLAPLPPPYYTVDEVVLHRNHAFLPGVADLMEDNHFAGQSFGALGLLNLAAQAGERNAVAAVWPHLTRLAHRSFQPAARWQFCLVRSPQGKDEEVMLPPRGDWPAIVRTSLDASLPGVPPRLAADPLLLLLFTIVCPHRMIPEVARFLGLNLGRPAPSSPDATAR